MEWFTIVALVLFGLVLIIVEVIFIPGTTFVGIIGFAVAAFGVWQSFITFGTQTGLIVLGISVTFSFISIFYSFKTGVWKRFALNNANNSKFNEDRKHNLLIGDKGVTISVLRPIGKAEFSEKEFEVKTNGSYLESGTVVQIVRIQNHTIVVEPYHGMEEEHNSFADKVI